MKKMSPVSVDSIQFNGLLGEGLRKTVATRLNAANYTMLVDPFRFRNEADNGWRCEFWGKVVRSAILAWKATGDEALLAKIRATVKDMISTQTDDGCISSYPAERQLGGWDVWGRKYVLAGLIRSYELVEQDPAILEACKKLVDHLMTQVGPDANSILKSGQHGGLAPASILFAIVKLYRYTRDEKYLNYAKWIADTGCSEVHKIYDAAIAGTFPKDIGNGKAYEMMSCFLGLAELYREVGDERYFKAAVKFYEMVRDREIYINGIGGLRDVVGEFWYDGKFNQCTDEFGAHGETCVTTTWIQYCFTILRLTEDPTIADEIECSLYNGLLGAMMPDGSNFTHRNPDFTGGEWACKIPAPDQIGLIFKTPYDGNDCCKAQGPEGLAMALPCAAIRTDKGLNVNLFEDMEITFRTPSEQAAELVITGGYPLNGNVKLSLALSAPETFTLNVRIPAWQKSDIAAKVNGAPCPATPGTYLTLEREWKDGDTIELSFDLTPQLQKDPGGSGRIAFKTGPVLLAQDSRLNNGESDLPVSADLPVRQETKEGFSQIWKTANGVLLCDYMSAGNSFRQEDRLTVWSREA